MKYQWIDEYLMKKTGVTKDLKEEWNWIRYMIGGKMFAAILLDWENQPYYINLKLDPSEGDFLRQQYEDIIPGYYSNKQHWNSIKPDGEVPDWLMKEMLDKSYALVLHGFSKKKQQEILLTTYCGLDCTNCEWKEPCHCNGCVSTKGMPFHCEKEPCPVAACAITRKASPSSLPRHSSNSDLCKQSPELSSLLAQKGVSFCGACDEFPCKLLNDYSYDAEHGDTPPGARIEACRQIEALLSKKLSKKD